MWLCRLTTDILGKRLTVVLAKALLYTHFNKKAEELALEDYKPGDKLIPFKVVGEYKGPDLVGMEYEQLIPWVKPVTVDENGKWQEAAGEAFRVIPGDYVTTEDGTGIVHIAPTFGADDAFVHVRRYSFSVHDKQEGGNPSYGGSDW